MLDARAAPAVDRLVIVADDERDGRVIAREQPQPRVLDGVGVLEFVHEQVPEPALVMRQQLGIVAPEFVGAQQELGEVDEPASLADFLVRLVKGDHLPAVRVALVVEMLRPQALVLLRIDEPLDLLRDPAAVVDLEVFQQALDQAQLVVGVDDLEILRQFRFLPVPPQQAVGEAVERAYPQVADGHAEQRLDTAAHFRRGLVGKRHGQQALRRDALDIDQPGGAVHEHAGLAAAGAGDNERRLGGRGDGLPLRVVQGFQYRGDVHEARNFSRIARGFVRAPSPGARGSRASSGLVRIEYGCRWTRSRRSALPRIR